MKAMVRLVREMMPVADLMVSISGRRASDPILGSIPSMGNHMSPMVSKPSYLA